MLRHLAWNGEGVARVPPRSLLYINSKTIWALHRQPQSSRELHASGYRCGTAKNALDIVRRMDQTMLVLPRMIHL